MSEPRIPHGTPLGVSIHRATQTPIVDCDCVHVARSQGLNELMSAFQRRTQRSEFNFGLNVSEDLGNRLEELLTREYTNRVQSGEDESSVRDDIAQRFTRDIKLPRTLDWHGGDAKTVVTPQESPRMPDTKRHSLLRALDVAHTMEDEVLQNTLMGQLNQRRLVPQPFSASGTTDLDRQRRDLEQQKRQLKGAISYHKRQAKYHSTKAKPDTLKADYHYGEITRAQKDLLRVETELGSRDWGGRRRGGRDVEGIQDFEEKRALSGLCADSTTHEPTMWIPPVDILDKSQESHIDKLTKGICSGCPLQEECHRHQILNEEKNWRGPTSVRERSGLRNKLVGLLDAFKGRKGSVLNLTNVLEPPQGVGRTKPQWDFVAPDDSKTP